MAHQETGTKDSVRIDLNDDDPWHGRLHFCCVVTQGWVPLMVTVVYDQPHQASYIVALLYFHFVFI
jgi:hypothetical protein